MCYVLILDLRVFWVLFGVFVVLLDFHFVRDECGCFGLFGVCRAFVGLISFGVCFWFARFDLFLGVLVGWV